MLVLQVQASKWSSDIGKQYCLTRMERVGRRGGSCGGLCGARQTTDWKTLHQTYPCRLSWQVKIIFMLWWKIIYFKDGKALDKKCVPCMGCRELCLPAQHQRHPAPRHSLTSMIQPCWRRLSHSPLQKAVLWCRPRTRSLSCVSLGRQGWPVVGGGWPRGVGGRRREASQRQPWRRGRGWRRPGRVSWGGKMWGEQRNNIPSC